VGISVLKFTSLRMPPKGCIRQIFFTDLFIRKFSGHRRAIETESMIDVMQVTNIMHTSFIL